MLIFLCYFWTLCIWKEVYRSLFGDYNYVCTIVLSRRWKKYQHQANEDTTYKHYTGCIQRLNKNIEIPREMRALKIIFILLKCVGGAGVITYWRHPYNDVNTLWSSAVEPALLYEVVFASCQRQETSNVGKLLKHLYWVLPWAMKP